MTSQIYKLISNKIFQLVYKLIIFFTIAVILYFKINYSKLLNTINLNSYSLILFLIMILLLLSIIYLIFKRWVILLSLNKQNNIDENKILIAVLYGNLSSELSFIGTFLSRAILTLPHKIMLKDVLVTSLLEKFLSAFFLAIITFPGILLLVYRDHQLFEGFSLILLILIFLSSIFLIFFIVFFKNINHLLQNNRIYASLKPYFSFKNLSKPFFLTCIIQLIGYLCLIIVPIILGIKINFNYYVILLPIIIFLSAIPISITPWGWRELVFIIIMNNIDITNEESFAISILYGLISLLTTILAVSIYELINNFRKI